MSVVRIIEGPYYSLFSDLALKGSQAAGGLVFINTSLFLLCKLSCSHKKSTAACIKVRSPLSLT